jgi:WD40 repeat protein
MLYLNKLPRAKGVGYQSGNRENCLRGTRRAELERVEEWEADYTAKVIYWLSGVAGSGKTTIARTFAERSAASGRLGASFFCSRNAERSRNIHLIFPTLAYHLARRYPEFKAALIRVIASNPDIGHESLDIQLENLIIQPLRSTRIHTTIVIDALDECEDKKPASAILSLLARRIDEIPFVKFFITGRPEPPIRTGFRLRSLRPHTEIFLLHEVERASVDHDIELYLRTCLSEIAAQRSHFDLTVPWPADEEIAAATKKCSGLFIVAYVIVKFVASRHHQPQERLRMIISRPDTVHEGRSGADHMYDHVFAHGFDDIDRDDTDFFDHLQLVVGSIVTAFNPLSCASLATILGISRDDVWIALRPLHSVLIVPDSELEPIRICHKSLADYLTDATRCMDSRFHINPSDLHLELGIRCLRLMRTSLRKNICQLPQYAMNSDVDDLDARRENYIGSELEYACRSWAKHLRFASRDGGDVGPAIECLKVFFSHHMLSWLEVLSVVSDLRCAVYSLQDVTAWLADVSRIPDFFFSHCSLIVNAQARSSDADLLAIVQDSERFVLRFFDAIECSASHIYESALPLSPSSSLVRAIYRNQISTDVKFNVIDNSWDTCIRTIRTLPIVRCISFSHKDDLIAVGKYNVVEIFEAATGQRRATFTPIINNFKFELSFAFSPDDTVLAVQCGVTSVWDLQTGGLVGSLDEHTDVTSVAFSACGTMLASSHVDGVIRVWDASSLNCQCVLEGHSRRIRTICWSTTGSEVISASEDSTVKIWNVFRRNCSKTITIGAGNVECLASSPNSSLIAYGSKHGTVHIFNARTGDLLERISTNTRSIGSIRFLNQDQIMYTTQEQHARFTIRDLTKGVDLLTFVYEGFCTAISSDGTCLASSSGRDVWIWQTNSLNQDAILRHANDVTCISFSTDGQLIASGFRTGPVKIWHASTGLCLTTFSGHSTEVEVVALSPNSTLCASRADSDVMRIWDIRTGNPISILGENIFFYISSIRFSLDSSQLMSVGHEGAAEDAPIILVELWDVATGGCLASTEMEDFSVDLGRDLTFDLDADEILEGVDWLQRWTLPSAPNFHDDSSINDEDPSSLPMIFVPTIQNTAPFTFPSESQHYCRHEKWSSWVLDRHQRRILWVPPGLCLKSDSCGRRVVFGSESSYGRVTIVDFSTDVERWILPHYFFTT